MMENEDWTLPTLKEHLENRIAELDRLMQSRFESRDERTRLLVTDFERRYAQNTDSIRSLREKEREFFTHMEHEIFATQIQNDINDMRETLIEENKPKWQVWATLVMVAVTILGGLWALAIAPIQGDLHRVENQLAAHQQNTADIMRHFADEAKSGKKP